MLSSRFTFLCSEIERVMIKELASHYQRTQSDTIRMILREKADDLEVLPKVLLRNDSVVSLEETQNG